MRVSNLKFKFEFLLSKHCFPELLFEPSSVLVSGYFDQVSEWMLSVWNQSQRKRFIHSRNKFVKEHSIDLPSNSDGSHSMLTSFPFDGIFFPLSQIVSLQPLTFLFSWCCFIFSYPHSGYRPPPISFSEAMSHSLTKWNRWWSIADEVRMRWGKGCIWKEKVFTVTELPFHHQILLRIHCSLHSILFFPSFSNQCLPSTLFAPFHLVTQGVKERM